MPEDTPNERDQATGEPRAESAETPAAGESFGTWLRQQRELREIGLHEIAERTKISIRYLRAMEQDRFDLLPGTIFARGFLREYAKYLGLEPDEVLNFYLATQQEQQEEELEAEAAAAGQRTGGRGLVPILAGILVVAVAAVFVLSHLERNREPDREAPVFSPPPVSAPEPTPSAEPPAPAEPAEAAVEQVGEPPPGERLPLEVVLDFSEDCWVEAVVDGDERMQQRYVQGEALRIWARERVRFVTLGNAGGVSIEVNGAPYPFEARSGQVVRDLVIDLESARAAAAEES